MSKVKKIGVLTSGGDSPGMNAVVRAVVRSANEFGLKVVGICRGYNGLMNGDCIELDNRSVGDIIQRGGTMLYTARCLEFMELAGQQQGHEMAKKLGLDGLVVVGGDGSFRGAAALSKLGLPTVGIPGTIDNDIACTDYSIGFDTACNIAMEAVDRLRDTTQSHEKCSLVEVMGRHAGHLALNVGVATGATAVLIPEKEYNLKEDISEKILAAQKSGKTHHIIIVAEGCKDTVAEIAKQIEADTGISSRLTVLGHIQRGGAPTVVDRVNATKMGYHAVELLEAGIGNRLVSIKDDHVVDFDIAEGLAMKKSIDEKLYNVCRIVSK
ncbi:MAG: 6-phosphofructokinase [Firmicutes bacterium]|nr:6-phosphofructokinase [Bacillota bacterium]